MDVGAIDDKPVVLDVAETSVVAQHFDARTSEGELFRDNGYGLWLNRLNLALRWDHLTLGARLDSTLYWRRPADRSDVPAGEASSIQLDGASRYRNSIYPAKLWVTYSEPGVEVTAGDAYVQFGRGLTLSMRKIDDLGLDTTLRGAKIAVQKDPFAFTLVGGIANPSRVDEATGRALFLPVQLPTDTTGPRPLFGSDRIVGAEIQAGRGLPVVLATHGVRLTRCAPYHYLPNGDVEQGLTATPLGTCDPQDVAAWLGSLPVGEGPALNASQIDVAGQSLEIPNIAGGHGKIYFEAAVQKRQHDYTPDDHNNDGNALYASATANAGLLTTTLEVKSYRNFFPLAASVDANRASEFNNVVYSVPPTAEVITQDSMFGFFNACVDGGRLRADVRLDEGLLLYGQGIYAYSKSEASGGYCDDKGNTRSGSLPAAKVHDTVVDTLSGIEWEFDRHRSHLFASGGVRNDTLEEGGFFYREVHGEYAFVKYLTGPYSVELSGRHRFRREEDVFDTSGAVVWWHEGENYTALKIAPKWVITQGFEYTTRPGFPTYYFNGSFIYKFTSSTNVRVFAGEQRGGLRCVSGICKLFPAFEGARVELTARF